MRRSLPPPKGSICRSRKYPPRMTPMSLTRSQSSTDCRSSEGLADGELEALGLIAPIHAGLVLRIQRDAVAEPEETQRGQPFHGKSGRTLQVSITRLVGDRGHPVDAVENRIVGLEYAAHIVEQAHPGALAPFRGDGDDQLGLAGDAHVAAVGVAELVPRAQEAFAEAAHRIGAAAEIVFIGRQSGGLAEGLAVVHRIQQGDRPWAPDRDVLAEADVSNPVLD